MPSSAQQSGTGIDSIISFVSAGSTAIGEICLVGSGSVRSGCVFDILTVGAAGRGSGIMEMRAVSFLGPGDGGGVIGAGGGGGKGASAKSSEIDGE